MFVQATFAWAAVVANARRNKGNKDKPPVETSHGFYQIKASFWRKVLERNVKYLVEAMAGDNKMLWDFRRSLATPTVVANEHYESRANLLDSTCRGGLMTAVFPSFQKKRAVMEVMDRAYSWLRH